MGNSDFVANSLDPVNVLSFNNDNTSNGEESTNNIDEITSNIFMHLQHQMRNPLVVIMGFSQFMSDYCSSLSNAEIGDMASRVYKSSNKLYNLISKFLLYAELEYMLKYTADSNLNKEEVVCSSEEIIKEIAHKVCKKYQREYLLLCNVKDVFLSVDENHLRMLLEEIIENSCKHSGDNIPLAVEGYRENNFYKIIVTDYGKGMSSDEINEVLSFPNVRGLFPESGVKIGLQIVKKITGYYNGRFELKSKINSFTKAEISLPLKLPTQWISEKFKVKN